MKNLFLSIVSVLILSSCASTASMWHADKRIKDISIGMDRKQVIGIMGESYLVNSSSKDPQGILTEVLVYKSSAHEEYRLKFIDNLLDSWNRIHLREYLQPGALHGAPPGN